MFQGWTLLSYTLLSTPWSSPFYDLQDRQQPRQNREVPSSSILPVITNTTLSQMLVTRSAARSRLWATQISLVARRYRAWVLHHEDKQLAKHLIIEVIDGVVLFDDLGRGLRVSIDKCVQAPLQHIYHFFSHAWHIDQWFKRRLIPDHDHDLGYSLAVITDSLQFDDDIEHGHDHPQITCHRLLRRDQLDAFLLYLKPSFVNIPVVGNNLVRQINVPALESIDRLTQALPTISSITTTSS